VEVRASDGSVKGQLVVVLALAALLVRPGTASAYHLADSLRGSSTGTAEGGSFARRARR
jgi:hypothetical protein